TVAINVLARVAGEDRIGDVDLGLIVINSPTEAGSAVGGKSALQDRQGGTIVVINRPAGAGGSNIAVERAVLERASRMIIIYRAGEAGEVAGESAAQNAQRCLVGDAPARHARLTTA